MSRVFSKLVAIKFSTRRTPYSFAGSGSRGIDVTHCLNINSNKDVEETEMSHLLVDPNVGVRPMFCAAYAKLLGQD